MVTGLKIKSLPRNGFLFKVGLRPCDYVLSINGSDIIDELDFYYHAAQDFLKIEIKRNGQLATVSVERPRGVSLNVEFFEKPINRCANRCVFCFIDQMPKGLRRSLYVKDEDVKHSFLNGNYVTLTSVSSKDLQRIVSIGLSPLFISVHATDKKVRATMLGNKQIPDIREQLSYLSANGIAFHTQIVLCPDINDGAILDMTICDLLDYGQSLLSIAVVPVGLTRFRKTSLKAVDKFRAIDIVNKVNAISSRMKKNYSVSKLFVADELFIRAEMAIPSASYYENYPQIENGVGLVRQLLQEGLKTKRKSAVFAKSGNNVCKKENCLVLTGYSAYPYLKKVLADISPHINKNVDVVSVENRYFGESVTVAGLLTASDVIKKIKKISTASLCLYDETILPAVMFNHAGYTLDGYSPSRIGKEAKMKIRVAGTIEEVINAR